MVILGNLRHPIIQRYHVCLLLAPIVDGVLPVDRSEPHAFTCSRRNFLWTWIFPIPKVIWNTGDFMLFFAARKTRNHPEPETVCWRGPVKSRWIGHYMKSRLQIQVNEQRHKSASEDWYCESAAVSPCQGHGCHAVNNTWRLSLHVCFHFSLLKCQQWKDWKREKRRKIINTSESWMHLVSKSFICNIRIVQKKNIYIEKKMLLRSMGIAGFFFFCLFFYIHRVLWKNWVSFSFLF